MLKVGFGQSPMNYKKANHISKKQNPSFGASREHVLGIVNGAKSLIKYEGGDMRPAGEFLLDSIENLFEHEVIFGKRPDNGMETSLHLNQIGCDELRSAAKGGINDAKNLCNLLLGQIITYMAGLTRGRTEIFVQNPLYKFSPESLERFKRLRTQGLPEQETKKAPVIRLVRPEGKD